MFDTARELLEKISLGEDSLLELKEVRFVGERVSAPHRDGLADELSAMANGRGGVCVLGVDDRTHEIIGIPPERLDDVERFVSELCHDSVEPPLIVYVEKVLLPTELGAELPVLKIDVPKSLFVHRSPGGYFHRIASSKRQMSPEYLARLFQQRSQARLIRFDEQVVSDATMADLDEALCERFRTSLSRTEPRDLLLQKLRMARRDEDGVVRPSVAGVLLGSRDPRAFIPNAFIQAVAYRGTSAIPGAGAQPYQLDAKDCAGPLDRQVIDALRFVAANMKVYATKALGREDLPQFDLTAVFEALVNAVVHRDYTIYGSKIRLRLFSDRLELSSPGALPNTMTIESLPLLQAARNEVLSSLLARLPVAAVDGGAARLDSPRTTYMDRRGEGVPTILERSERLSGRGPEYALIADAEVCVTIWAATPLEDEEPRSEAPDQETRR